MQSPKPDSPAERSAETLPEEPFSAYGHIRHSEGVTETTDWVAKRDYNTLRALAARAIAERDEARRELAAREAFWEEHHKQPDHKECGKCKSLIAIWTPAQIKEVERQGRIFSDKLKPGIQAGDDYVASLASAQDAGKEK